MVAATGFRPGTVPCAAVELAQEQPEENPRTKFQQKEAMFLLWRGPLQRPRAGSKPQSELWRSGNLLRERRAVVGFPRELQPEQRQGTPPERRNGGVTPPGLHASLDHDHSEARASFALDCSAAAVALCRSH